MVCLSLADIGASEFNFSLLGGGTIYEILAMAKPLMGRRDDHLYRDTHGDLYPMIDIRSSADTTSALLDYVKRPAYYQDMGELGRQWFQKRVVEQGVTAYVDMINSAAKGQRS